MLKKFPIIGMFQKPWKPGIELAHFSGIVVCIYTKMKYCLETVKRLQPGKMLVTKSWGAVAARGLGAHLHDIVP